MICVFFQLCLEQWWKINISDWAIRKWIFLKKKLDFSRWLTIANTSFWANQSICKVWSCQVQPFRRRCIYKKVHYFTLDLRSRTTTKRCPVSSTSYDLCTCKVWSCIYVQQFRRKCIYKKYLIWPWPWFDLDLKVKVTWSIVFYIMWPMYLQSLKLLRPMVKEMHYQKNIKMLPSTPKFMWPMHQQSLMLLHPMVKEKMHLQENTLFDLDQVKVTRNVAQCPLHHVNYAPTEFEVNSQKL